MLQDSTTYKVPARLIHEGDSVYVEMSEQEIESIHESIQRQANAMLHKPETVSNIVMLGFSYIPILFVVAVLVNLVNRRWNIAYRRMEKLKTEIATTPERLIKWGMLKFQRIKLWNRFSNYLFLWIISLIGDAYLLFYDFEKVPLCAFMLVVYLILRIAKRLSASNYLTGYSDEDIVDNFEKIAEKMIIRPILNKITYALKTRHHITNNDEEETK